MSKPAHLLLIGNDRRLLSTRAKVLLNFWGVSAITPAEDSAPRLTPDALVLCHTLTEVERHHFISSFRAVAPTGLVVSLDFLDLGPRLGTDATVDHGKGPAALVYAIYELLTERGLASKEWVAGGRTLLGSAPRTR